MGNDVAADFGEPERRGAEGTDTDETFIILCERHCERDESPVRQRDYQISFHLQET
jgi:hypothetical protein